MTGDSYDDALMSVLHNAVDVRVPMMELSRRLPRALRLSIFRIVSQVPKDLLYLNQPWLLSHVYDYSDRGSCAMGGVPDFTVSRLGTRQRTLWA